MKLIKKRKIEFQDVKESRGEKNFLIGRGAEMATCTLCGTEEIEKPIIYIGLTSKRVEVHIPFGRYCWSRKRKSCLKVAQDMIELRNKEGM